jgi:hypothetical protein
MDYLKLGESVQELQDSYAERTKKEENNIVITLMIGQLLW